MRKRLLGLIALFYIILNSTNAQPARSDSARMAWFDDAKFGIFIHWGIYSVKGVDESWSFFNGYTSHDSYLEQLKGFTASKYNPDSWANLIAESGARYAVLTSKHHDGVALWQVPDKGLNVVDNTPAGVLSTTLSPLSGTCHKATPSWCLLVRTAYLAPLSAMRLAQLSGLYLLAVNPFNCSR